LRFFPALERLRLGRPANEELLLRYILVSQKNPTIQSASIRKILENRIWSRIRSASFLVTLERIPSNIVPGGSKQLLLSRLKAKHERLKGI
jgi:hypothetical protein